MLPGVDWKYLIPAGKVATLSHINKYGRTTNADTGVETDVWDRANAGHNQPIWLAPTAARVHAIVSTDTDDADGGDGARTLRIFGLTDWDSVEVSEDIVLNGTTPVNTTNSYVIIHRMLILTCGVNVNNSPNLGTITATAATDSTVTAQMEPNAGQTQMAIYGVPSVQRAYLPFAYGSINRAQSVAVNFTFWRSTDVSNRPNTFTIANTIGAASDGDSSPIFERAPFPVFQGPAILKISANTSAVNGDCSAGFDLILERPVGTL